MEAEFRDGAMHFTGTSSKPDGTTAARRSTLARLDNGHVHMFIEESADEGQSWATLFEAEYSP